nr:uncharacterized protein LOC129018289 isoform X2 [Pongo pygmaeus]
MGPSTLAGGHHSTCWGRMDMVEDADTLQKREDIIMKYENVQVMKEKSKRSSEHIHQVYLNMSWTVGNHIFFRDRHGVKIPQPKWQDSSGAPRPSGACGAHVTTQDHVSSVLPPKRITMEDDVGPELSKTARPVDGASFFPSHHTCWMGPRSRWP